MKIGYQLYSARELCGGGEALKRTIQVIAAMGYDGVEFYGYEGIPAGELKEFLKECNVEAMNSHVQLERWEADAGRELAYAKEAGIPCVTVPWMAPKIRNPEGFSMVRTLLSKICSLGKAYDIKIAYHNHDFEFAKEADRYVLDMILDSDGETGLELDTFWTYYAGVDPVSYMEEKKDRLRMIHVKDYLSLTGGGMAGGQEMPVFSAVGTGKMKNKPILEWAEKNGLPWVIVEQDNSRADILESAKLSLKALKDYRNL